MVVRMILPLTPRTECLRFEKRNPLNKSSSTIGAPMINAIAINIGGAALVRLTKSSGISISKK